MKIIALPESRTPPPHGSVSDTVAQIIRENPELDRPNLVQLCIAAGVREGSARTMVQEFCTLFEVKA